MAKIINPKKGLNEAKKKQAEDTPKVGRLIGFNFYYEGKPLHAGLPDSAYHSVPPDFVSQGIRNY